jgi:hypothetical protein
MADGPLHRLYTNSPNSKPLKLASSRAGGTLAAAVDGKVHENSVRLAGLLAPPEDFPMRRGPFLVGGNEKLSAFLARGAGRP